MFKVKLPSHAEKGGKLNNDLRCVVLRPGMGIFIAITHFILFHTVLVIVPAVLLAASKLAAILGGWVSNSVIGVRNSRLYFNQRICIRLRQVASQ